jgi:hypothetical protein
VGQILSFFDNETVVSIPDDECRFRDLVEDSGFSVSPPTDSVHSSVGGGLLNTCACGAVRLMGGTPLCWKGLATPSGK